MQSHNKSPLKNSPLRMLGQSLDEEMQQLLRNEVPSNLLFPFLLIIFSIYDWLLWYQIVPLPNPILVSVIAIGASVYCFFSLIKLRKHFRALKLGKDGERAVGQTLEALRRKGYRIFHDLVGEGFNLDHVIVSEHGIFSIETKTYSKPAKGECKIIYSVDGISINGFKPDKKIIIQILAQKNWLGKHIATITEHKFSVKPVVVFQQFSLWLYEPSFWQGCQNPVPWTVA